jgi:pimeloyl-ACP methyl ester carboxylesterase
VTGLQRPPSKGAPSRTFLRIVVLAFLVVILGVVFWAVVTIQEIGRTETRSQDDLELAGPASVEGMTVNVVHEGLGSLPVILLHDVDVAGSAIWDPVVGELGGEVTAVKIDLPGFGLSSRIPTESVEHTVASMAQVVAEIVDERFAGAVVFAGVGLGGEVAAEVAVTRPELVAGLVMIDVDFRSSDRWIEFAEKLPYVGQAVTFGFKAGGSFGVDTWAPNCEDGGWCPTADQLGARALATSLVGTTDSLAAFLRTTPSSFVPGQLDEITAPAIYVWSEGGIVPRDSVDQIVAMMVDLDLRAANVWKAHLEDPAFVAEAILAVAP